MLSLIQPSTDKSPRLLGLRRNGRTGSVILDVEVPGGERKQIRCGKGEPYRPRKWDWRNSSVSFLDELTGRVFTFSANARDLVEFRKVFDRVSA